ncbi:MAG TPA: hypothetical protein VIN67_00740 [Desulfobaccales bacterium]
MIQMALLSFGLPGLSSLAAESIANLRVAVPKEVRRKYLFGDLSYKPVFMTLQEGRISAGVAGCSAARPAWTRADTKCNGWTRTTTPTSDVL